jgi:hypothetical protein
MLRTTLIGHRFTRICTLGKLYELFVRSVEIRENPCPIFISAFSGPWQFAFWLRPQSYAVFLCYPLGD